MRNAILTVLLAGCAGGAREARIAREIEPALKRGDLKAAVAAYEPLGPRREPALRLLASTAVWRSLHAPSADERLEAARIAGDARDASLDAELSGRLADEDARVRAVAASALARDSAAARDRLREALASPDATVRGYALDGLSSLPEAKEWLAKLEADPDPGVRATILRGQPSMAAVERGLADASLGVRLAAVAALGKLGASPAKLAALGVSSDRFVALRAAVALSRLGRSADARAVVEAAAADKRAEVRSAAMNAAGELGADARAIAESLLRDPDPGVRLDAARALVAIGRPELARPALERLLATPLSLDATAQLARLGDPAMLALLDRAARTGRAALARFASFPTALPALTHALASDDTQLRLTAAAAILRRTR